MILNLKNNISTIFFILILNSFGQQKPVLKFQKDSVLIGEPTPVSFSYIYDSKKNIIFPDSTYNFSPFEYDRREIFTTETDSLSVDSCVYWLSTFEIDKLQTLKLPVFIFNKKDSIPVYSNTDSIYLTEVITTVSDTLKIKENTTFQEVETDFNSLLFSIISGSIILTLLILSILFRKKIILYFKLRKLKKAFEKFNFDYENAISKYRNDKKSENLELILSIWKSYIEKTTTIPYTKLSTKEIQQTITEQTIIELLKAADGELFGGIKTQNYNFEDLKAYANSMFNQKMKELQND